VINIDRIDHVVLTCRSIEATCEFYRRVLGMRVVTFGEGRTALAFGRQKFNLHQAGREFKPKADRPVPGSADFCLVTDTPMPEILAHLAREGVKVVEGPTEKTGAIGRLLSVYLRDPDANLVEISNYLD
jgi:catechol 2,3-dioxygenase-like lactoylglutathione lyase family enzyme